MLEKWFLSSKLGEKAWYIPGEFYYYNNLKVYYNNLARVGLVYEELNYERGMPFLLMLPQASISDWRFQKNGYDYQGDVEVQNNQNK